VLLSFMFCRILIGFMVCHELECSCICFVLLVEGAEEAKQGKTKNKHLYVGLDLDG